jgi:hypothetical protein
MYILFIHQLGHTGLYFLGIMNNAVNIYIQVIFMDILFLLRKLEVELNYSYPSGSGVISHCVVDLHFSDS